MTVGADRPSPRGGSCKTTEQMNGIIEALGGAKHRIECAMSRRLTLGAAIASPRSSGGPAEGGRETNVRLTTKTTTCPAHKVGISRFSSKTGVYFLLRKSRFQLYLADSYVDPPICKNSNKIWILRSTYSLALKLEVLNIVSIL